MNNSKIKTGILIVIAAAITLGFSSHLVSQAIIPSYGTSVTEDFNTLALSGATNTVVPTGWVFIETGSGGNTTYAAGTGSDNAGNTYSYGAASVAERAFGGLRSGTVVPTIGANYTNMTGGVITSLAIDYKGEQWRLGAVGRVDKWDFQYSTDATSLTTGTWTNFDPLDFTAPVTAGTLGALNGNSTANSDIMSATITGLAVANNATIWFRWNDVDAAGSDDGLSVDSFSIVACAPVTCPGNMTVCSGDATFSLTGGLPAGGTYTGSGVTANMFNPAAASLGANLITYTFDDMGGCSGSCTFTITVNQSPTVTCPVDLTVCSTDAPFVLTGENPTGGDYSGPGVTGTTFDPSMADPGVNFIAYDYTAGNGCSGFCTFSITVTTPPTVLCPVDMTVCTSAAPFALTGGSPAGGTYSGTGVVGPNFDPAMANLGNNVITYMYSSGSCSGFCTFTINVTTSVTVTCPVDISVCSTDAPFALTGGSPGGGMYTGTGVVGANFDPAAANLGVNVITYTYVSGTCNGSCNFNITVSAGPIASAGSYGPVCVNDPNVALVGSPAGGVWTGLGIVGGNMFDPNAGTQTLTYTVTVGSCTDSDQTTITVNPCLMAPEVRWILMQQSQNYGGTCNSLSNCGGDQICFGLQYTPSTSGVLESYTAGFTIPCLSMNNVVLYNQTCWNNDNSEIIPLCSFGFTSFNSSVDGLPGTPSMVAGTPIILHQVCFNIPNTGSFTISESALDITMTINPSGGGNAITDFPAYTPFSFDSMLYCGLLPVTYLSFDAKKYAELQSVLDWVTTDEINNAYFSVQRSNDGGATFRTIGRVDAAQHPDAINDYSFIDPTAKPGANLYRLQQYDRDGKFQYSPVRSVNFTTTGFSVKAWPSPATEMLNITVNNADEPGKIHLVDLAGRLVLEMEFDKGATDNDAFVSQLPSGMYTLIVTTGANKHIEKIVVID